MKKREKRRDQTIRYGERCLRVHLRVLDPRPGEPAYEKTPWYFAKGKAMGCRCRRSPSGKPKQRASICGRGSDWHPSVHERIRGARLARAWLLAVRGGDADDVEL